MTTQAVSYTKNTPPSIWEQATDYLATRDGVYRTQKLASDTLSLASESAALAGHSLPRCSEAGAVLGNGAMGVIVPLAVGSTIDLGRDAVKYAKRSTPLSWGEGVDFVQKVSLSAEMLAYSAFLFTKRAVYNSFGDLCAAVEDGLDIVLERDAYRGFQEAVQPAAGSQTGTGVIASAVGGCGTPRAMELLHAERAAEAAERTAVAKVYFTEFKKLHYLKLAKAITAFAVGVFGLLGLYYGAPVIPSVALLAMSVVSSALAIFNRWYKQNMTYNLEKQPTPAVQV